MSIYNKSAVEFHYYKQRKSKYFIWLQIEHNN